MDQIIDSSLAKQFDRLPPHSLEAEQCLLASMMLDKEIVGQVVQIVDRDAFYQADHQILYDIVVKLYEANRPTDTVIVREELIKRQLLDEVGGTAYLAQLLNTVPSAAHGAHYAGIVREKAMLRQLISASNDILRNAYAPHETADIVLDKAEKLIFDIAEKKVSGSMTHLETVLLEVFESIENRGQRGLETGFIELDEMTNGLQKGEMIIVAARPSMGKAQPLDANVLTPAGFKKMAALRVGDELASIDGAPSHVTGIYPQGQRQVYRLTFADGRSTEACAEHLWRIHSPHWPTPRTLQTSDLLPLLNDPLHHDSLSIDTFTGHFGSDAPLPLDPWLLGTLLTDTAPNDIRSSQAQGLQSLGPCHSERSEESRPSNHEKPSPAAPRPTWLASSRNSPLPPFPVGWAPPTSSPPGEGRGEGSAQRPIPLQAIVASQFSGSTALLQAARPIATRNESPNTRRPTPALHTTPSSIPPAYLTASRESRARLLAALLNIDTLDENASYIFSTPSPRLASDVLTLARSLGATASITTSSHSHTCTIQLTPRRLTLTSITPTRTTETQCISVSHPTRLYVTDDYIVTHNTAFAMNLIEGVACEGGHPCAVFSLEMSKQQLAQRMLCSRGNVDAHKLRKGSLTSQEFQKLAVTVGELAKAPIWVDDAPGLTILEFRAKARRLKMQHDVKMIMIDYLQLMDNPGAESRQQAIGDISRGIKAVARELMIPIVTLSQLNRGSEGRDGHRPRMSDLRESGSIEQDADVIALLHREDYYRLQEPDFVPDNIAEIIIAKQRNGPTGTIKLTFDNKCTRFRNLSAAADPF